MFQSPPPTRLDLNFSLFGFPIRVHPMFWLICILLGYGAGSIASILIWVVAVFVSIIIHELGHSFAMRAFGVSSHIVLHFMGGLAIPDGFAYGRRTALSNPQQILISLAGPGAGFFFAALLLLGVQLAGGFYEFGRPIPIPQAFVPLGGPYQLYLNDALRALLWINVGWGLINLLPVFPLDGGQVARYFLTMIDPRNGYTNSLWLSIIFGAAAAIGGFVYLRSIYIALIFGLLAYQSYQQLSYR